MFLINSSKVMNETIKALLRTSIRYEKLKRQREYHLKEAKILEQRMQFLQDTKARIEAQQEEQVILFL